MTDLFRDFIKLEPDTLMIVAGLVLLILAAVGNISGKIQPGRNGRLFAGAIGVLLLAVGSAIHFGKGRPAPSEVDVMEGPKASTEVGTPTSNGASSHAAVTPKSEPSQGSSTPSLVLDLLDDAVQARWISGNGAAVLSFGGRTDDPRGYALWVGPVQLEDGVVVEHALRTDPEWKAGGEISGDFKLRQPISPGDRFKSKVGFLQGAGGNAEFVVRVSGGSSPDTREVARTMDSGHDGILRTIDVDLTPFVGCTRIIIEVVAGAAFGQDWAVWVNPRIEH